MFFYSARADLLLAPSPFALGQTSQLFYIVSLLGGPSASSQPAPFAHDFDETLPMDIDVVETIDLAPAEEQFQESQVDTSMDLPPDFFAVPPVGNKPADSKPDGEPGITSAKAGGHQQPP